MTRFARAKGSKSSNERLPEEATSWGEIKQQLEQKSKEIETNKKLAVAKIQRDANYKKFLDDKEEEELKNTKWADFPGVTKIDSKSKVKNKKVKGKIELAVENTTELNGKKKKGFKVDDDDENDEEFLGLKSQLDKILDKQLNGDVKKPAILKNLTQEKKAKQPKKKLLKIVTDKEKKLEESTEINNKKQNSDKTTNKQQKKVEANEETEAVKKPKKKKFEEGVENFTNGDIKKKFKKQPKNEDTEVPLKPKMKKLEVNTNGDIKKKNKKQASKQTMNEDIEVETKKAEETEATENFENMTEEQKKLAKKKERRQQQRQKKKQKLFELKKVSENTEEKQPKTKLKGGEKAKEKKVKVMKKQEDLTEEDKAKIERKKEKKVKQLERKKLKKQLLKEEKERNLQNGVIDNNESFQGVKAKEENAIIDNNNHEYKFGAPKKSSNANNPNKKPGKPRDKEEHPRKKAPLPKRMMINGKEVDVDYVDGFPVKKEDAERLKQLRREMISKGLPRSEINVAMKLERRKAEKAFAREKKKVCFNCRKSGHNLSECPELDKNQVAQTSGSGICFKCGSTEHTHFECKVVRGQEFKFASCFICNEQGHIARQCPDNARGLYPKGGACNVCGDVTHLKKDCPKFQSQQQAFGENFKLEAWKGGNPDDLNGGEDFKSNGLGGKSKPNKIIKF